MIEDLKIFQMASSMARHASARMRVIAENVANADTPGYRARDLQSFSNLVNRDFTPNASRPGHVNAANQSQERTRPDLVFLSHVPSPNGNSVSIEDQALRAVETQGQHRLARDVYAKSIDIMRLGLGRGR